MVTIPVYFFPVNPQQDKFLRSQAIRIMFSGAFGAGKTVALCAKALQLSLDYPKNFGLLARKTRKSMTHTTIRSFFRQVCPPSAIVDYNKNEDIVTLDNRSQIIFGGLDDPLKLGSLELGWCGIDEAIETEEDEWQMLEGRLRLPGVPHQIFCATNPGPPSHYLYKMFFQDRKGEVYQAGTLENPELPADYRERVQEYEGVYYQRYVLGQWVGLEGLVYSSFNEQACIVPRFPIRQDWLIYSGHDFGSANPAAMFFAQDPATGLFWAFHEYLGGDGKSIHDNVQRFKQVTDGYNVVWRKGGSHQEDEIRQGYTAHGWPILEPKIQKVEAQIERVKGLHRLNKVMVFSDLTNYLREKLSYIYKRQGDVLTDEIENKNRFHLMDAERYILSDFTPETVNRGAHSKAISNH